MVLRVDKANANDINPLSPSVALIYKPVIDLHSKSIDRFLYEVNIGTQWVNKVFTELLKESNLDYTSHENMKESHINLCSLYINILVEPVLQFNPSSPVHFWKL